MERVTDGRAGRLRSFRYGFDPFATGFAESRSGHFWDAPQNDKGLPEGKPLICMVATSGFEPPTPAL